MDQLAGRINRTGVAANISSHLMWRSVADQAISDYRRDPKPITVIGHSIGGDAAVYSATRYYLRAIEAAGTDEAKAVMAKMREIPINDFSAKSGCNFRRGKEVSPRSKSL